MSDLDFGRLSARSRETLQAIVVPLSEGSTVAEVARRLGITKRQLEEARAALAAELEAQSSGAQVRDLTPEEYEALRESIRVHGQLVPALRDRSGKIITGRNRVRACRELGVEPWVEEWDGSPETAHDVALAENFVRRHLTSSDRRRAVSDELQRDPSRSDRAIATVVGVSPTTVGGVRAELERHGSVSRVDTRKGRDGVEQRTPQKRASSRGQRDEKAPSSRLDYIAVELRSLAALADKAAAHAKADVLVAEALRLAGAVTVADAFEEGRWWV